MDWLILRMFVRCPYFEILISVESAELVESNKILALPML